MAGCTVEGLSRIMDMGMKEMGDNFTVTDIPGKAINGAWSPWANPTTDNGQAWPYCEAMYPACISSIKNMVQGMISITTWQSPTTQQLHLI
ncbi:hypothetical protein N5V81_13495 [Escherichia coli]|nr:hypothetical protein [Escherichia coli]